MKRNVLIMSIMIVVVLALMLDHRGGNGFTNEKGNGFANEKGNGIIYEESGGSVATDLVSKAGHGQEGFASDSKDRGGFSDSGRVGNGIINSSGIGGVGGGGFSDGQERNGLEKDSGGAGNGLQEGKEGGNGLDSTGGGNG